MILTKAKPSDLWVPYGFHKNVDMSTDEKLVVENLMYLKRITIPEQSAFAGHRYLQNADEACTVEDFIRYHMHLILHGHELMDATLFEYSLIIRYAGEQSQPLPTLNDCRTVLLVWQLLSNIHSNGRAVGDKGYLYSTPWQNINEGIQSLKCMAFDEKD